MGYTRSAIKGISWMSGFRMTNRIMVFLKIAILARLLTPSEFGIFGIASLLLAFLEILTESGINVVLIQKQDEIGKYIDSAWIISILRGIFIFLIILVSAPFVASFFNSPASLGIILLISISPLIKGFINPAEIKFQKELKFNYEFWFRTSLYFADAFVSIVVALITHSVYSLAFGLLAGSILEVILSFVFISPRPKLRFNIEHTKEIFHKGKWVTAYGILNYIGENGDNIIVGRVLGATTLGFYQMAYKVSYIPISEISDVVNKVIFPVYSKIGQDRKRLISAFWKTTGVISVLTIAVGTVIFFFPKEIISIILGNQWISVAPVLKILSVYGIVRAALGPASAMFLAIEKQRYVTFVVLIRCLTLVLTIYPFVHLYGMMGAGYSALLSALTEFPVILFLAYKISKEKV
jgi:O-antigen/teichoic acid export membrane protein